MKDKVIWIDKEKAYILTVKEEDVDMEVLTSRTAELGEEPTDRQGGATEILKDRKVLERQKQMTKQYFDALSTKLQDAKRIMIMGPAQTGQHFFNYLDQEKNSISKQVLEVKKAEKMTDNQLKAVAREYYLSIS
ncbi:hypothetical protein [uncultured Winogradskyella sp.]|uniref:hypothetical protein n=1 Tax=uncultured Winogradskyella sp. TaxID=395353 RepID=UPI003516C4D9